MFGSSNNNNNTPFGSSSGFGQASNTTPAFGSPAPAPGGIFGNPAPAAPFGAPAPAFGSTFGAPAPSNNLFGSSPAPSTFGAPASGFGASAPSAFGAPAPAFGTPAPTSGFGAPSTGLFGAPSPAPAFGTSTGFGAPAAAATGFGGSTFGGGAPTSTFGAPAPSNNLFGGAAAPAPFGAPAAPFGSSAPATFGAPSAPFGAPTSSPFGATAPAPFGTPAPSPGIFGGSAPTPFGGSPAPATGGLFGSPAAAPSTGMFGGAPAATPGSGGSRVAPYAATTKTDGTNTIRLQAISAMSQYEAKSHEELRFEDYSQGNRGTPAATGGFGAAPAPQTGFGAPGSFGAPAPAFGAPTPSAFAPATGGGGFGSASTFGGAPAPAFGAPPATPGLFGSTPASTFGTPAPAFGAPAPTPGFGAPAPATGGLFGPTPAPTFGAPSATAFGSTPAPAFGTPAVSTGLFGGPAPSAFGVPAPAPGLFGAAPTTGFGLGAKSPGPGMFGAPAAPAFGAPAAPANGLFSQPAVATATLSAIPINSVVIPQAAQEILEQKIRAVCQQKEEMEKHNIWKGTSTSATTPASNPESADGLAYRSYSPQVVPSPKSRATIRPRGFPMSSDRKPTPSVSSRSRENRAFMSPEAQARSTALTLVLKPETKNLRKQAPKLHFSEDISSPPPESFYSPPQEASPPQPATPSTNGQPRSRSTPTTGSTSTPGLQYYQQVIGASAGESVTPSADSTEGRHTLVPKLTKNSYSCTPSVEDLQLMSEAELATVPQFSVLRDGYGQVEWEGSVDVRGADLDSIVNIEQSSVEIYSLEELRGEKPPVGTKLNRAAILTCFNVYPKHGPSASEEEKERFAKKVERNTRKIGAELVDYNKATGVWKIRVRHFSRYSMHDVSDDEDEVEPMVPDHANLPVKRKLGLKTSPSRFVVDDTSIPSYSDESTRLWEENVQTVTTAKRAAVIAALDVDGITPQRLVKRPVSPDLQSESPDNFLAEEGDSPSDVDARHFVPSPRDIEATRASTFSICSSFQQKADVSSSALDSHMVMRKSFRVGWLPNGNLYQLKNDRTLTLCKPSPHSPISTDQLHWHRSSSSRTMTDSDVPLYSLAGREEDGRHFERLLDICRSGNSVEFRRALCLLLSVARMGDTPDMVNLALQFMRTISENDVTQKVAGSTDVFANVFACLVGGDILRAVEVATAADEMDLAAILVWGSEGCKNIQGHLLNESLERNEETVHRVLKACACDKTFEDSLARRGVSSLGWQERLTLRLWQCEDADLGKALGDFEEGVRAGNIPFPAPLSSNTSNVPSVVFNLLKACAGTEKHAVQVITPKGLSLDKHRFDCSFHLACAVCSTLRSMVISLFEAEHMIDGYVSALVASGHWMWAVYVTLCTVDQTESYSIAVAKRSRAKDLVLRHFTGQDLNAKRFLVEIGIPVKWLFEAVAHRSAAESNESAYVENAFASNPDMALWILETKILPEVFFQDSSDRIINTMQMVEATLPDETEVGLACTMYTYYELKQQLDAAAMGDLRPDSWKEESMALELELREHMTRLEKESTWGLFEKAAHAPSSLDMVVGALSRLKNMQIQVECMAIKQPALLDQGSVMVE